MDANTIIILSVWVAYGLDLWLGDPAWLPHPIIGFGKSIAFLEKKLNQNGYLKVKGFVMVILLTGLTYTLFYLITIWVINNDIWLYAIYTTLFIFLGLANHTLIKEVRDVFTVLSKHGLEAGRTQISRLVGRETNQLSAQQIKTAALETLSENLSDGVVAPLFYFAIAGIPGLMTYKMINTMDSMVGYKNKRYKQFGYAAAKLDDIANFIPARLTALLMVLVSMSRQGFIYMFKYGSKHSSPNAGYPEAALAGILNCRFGGPNLYHGQLVDKPYIGTNNKQLTNNDLIKSLSINHLVCLICILLISVKIFYFGA